MKFIPFLVLLISCTSLLSKTSEGEIIKEIDTAEKIKNDLLVGQQPSVNLFKVKF